MYNYQNKLQILDHELSLNELHIQVNEINQIIEKLNNKEVLDKAPRRLGFYPNEIEELGEKIDSDEIKKLIMANNLLNNFRSFISREFGLWSLANLQTAQQIKESFGTKVGLEVMAGNGYWSKALNEVGVTMIATDSFSWARSSSTGRRPFYPTKSYTAGEAVKTFTQVDLIICCWAPNFGDGDKKILETWRQYGNPKTTLLFIGEKNGATNTSAFWREANDIHSPQLRKVNRSFETFDFIKEKIYEIK